MRDPEFNQTPPLTTSGLEEILGDLLGAFGVRTGKHARIQQTLDIDFEEAALGCEKAVEYERLDRCGTCGGRGAEPGTGMSECASCEGQGRVRAAALLMPVPLERPCKNCHGTGKIPQHPCRTCAGKGVSLSTRLLRVSIPAGAENSSSLSIAESGHRLHPDEPAGDLELLVQVRPHPIFRREGDDIVCQASVPFIRAALGGSIEVPTLEGTLKVPVPAATQPGTVLRVRGRGFKHRSRSGRGDQLIEVKLTVPSELSTRAHQLLAELSQELKTLPKPQTPGFFQKIKNLFG